MNGGYVRCYLCGERRPKADTEVVRHRVSSVTRGGTVQGVNRYVRMCKIGHGCKEPPKNDSTRRSTP